MSTITTERLAASVGALVDGVDVDRLLNDESIPEVVLDALEHNGVLVFKGLHITDPEQVEFSKRLGPVETFRVNKELPEIFNVTLDPTRNPSAEYLKGTFTWHIDGLMEEIPIMATILSAHAVAETGGETEFASSYQAYEDLSDADKAAYEQIRIVHTMEASQRVHIADPTPEQVEMWRKRPDKVHPLVWTHLSGRKSLVLGATASHVEGRPFEEGRKFLDEVLERSTVQERVYRHTWDVGDMVIWDNRGVLHRACPYDPTSPRDMHRTTLFGNERVQ